MTLLTEAVRVKVFCFVANDPARALAVRVFLQSVLSQTARAVGRQALTGQTSRLAIDTRGSHKCLVVSTGLDALGADESVLSVVTSDALVRARFTPEASRSTSRTLVIAGSVLSIGTNSFAAALVVEECSKVSDLTLRAVGGCKRALDTDGIARIADTHLSIEVFSWIAWICNEDSSFRFRFTMMIAAE